MGGEIMELRVLNYFLAVAREESFTKAANILHVTQPTLSRQIAELERELGVKLFIRSNHNIILTEDGMILKRRAQELLSLAQKTKMDFSRSGHDLEGLVSIGSGEFLSTGCLAECISAFSRLRPLVRYEIQSGNASNISENIDRGLLDLGLISEPYDLRKYESISMPVSEQWGALVRADSPLAGKVSITPADLAGIPLISTASDFMDSRIKKWFGGLSGEMKIIARGNLLYNEAMLALHNIGAVIGIRLGCQYEGLKFIPLSPAVETTTALVWKKDLIFSPATASFIDFAKQYFKGITDNKL